MRPNLIFLESHDDSSIKEFVTNNIHELLKLGYKTLMLEIPALQLAQIKKNFEKIVSYRREYQEQTTQIPIELELTIKSAEAWLNLFKTIETLEIDYRCIDTEDPELDKKLVTAQTSSSTPKLVSSAQIMEMGKVTSRDEIMASIILKEVRYQQGGIIFIGGFAHSTLAHVLDRADVVPTEIVIMLDESEPVQTFRRANNHLFASYFPNSTYRQQIYGRETHYFGQQPSFHLFDKVCHLSERIIPKTLHPCSEMPSVGKWFNDKMNIPFEYAMDSDSILYAKFSHGDKEKLQVLKTAFSYAFKGLTTFFQDSKTHQNQKELIVQGLNLPDQQQMVQKYFSPK